MARTESSVRAPGVYLADGTKLKASAGYANGDLWIWMEDGNEKGLVELVILFGDPEKVSKVLYVATETVEQEWEGFTRLTTAKIDEDGVISIRMRKG